jgi:tRNA pseudouridine13 synthase
MRFDALAAVPYLTAGLPGIGGRIKHVPEDFDVEEIPAYEPSGAGDFLYLWVEKRGMGAEYFTRQVARRLGIAIGEVGTAGLKDRHAVTRQMVSVPETAETRIKELDGDGIRVLKVDRHTNKLRPGHLHGNRFRILVRAPDERSSELLPPLLERLRHDGLPNYFGAQRFGRDGETLRLGLRLLGVQDSVDDSARPRMVRDRFLKKLSLSAVQSALFNHYLAARIRDGWFRSVLAGDVMMKRPFGGMFVVTDVNREQVRFDARETVHAGPVFGRKTFSAADTAAAREAAVLQDAGLTQHAFRKFGQLLKGTRRPNVVYLDDLVVSTEDEGIRVAVTLPAGAYASVLLRELMKNEVVDPDAPQISLRNSDSCS